jgi:hypothetical protein
MANKIYYLQFGSGNPALFSGLFPTFTIFNAQGQTSLAAPGITEIPIGSGLYQFQYAPTLSILFLADGGAGLSNGDRFISATLDPIQAVDQQIGYATDSFGSTSTDPTTLWGYLKRLVEFNEGDSIFSKATGIWQIFTRGSTTLLRTKSLTNTTSSATKTGL